MPETSAPNLFAAAKGYVVAMSRLAPAFREERGASSIAMAYYLLAGFAVELSLKAIVLRTRQDTKFLRTLGHDLPANLKEAISCGLIVEDGDEFTKLVDRLGPIHKGHIARYVPDVERIDLPGPFLVLSLLDLHLARVEKQFDVWEDELESYK